MFEGKSLLEILAIGGWTLYILLLASMVSISIIVFKFIEFRKKAKVDTKSLLLKIKVRLQKQSIESALSFCEDSNTPVSNVIKSGILYFQRTKSSDVKDAMNREISIETVKLEKYTTILGTIGGISVYVGLFGTVIGIIRSFHDISLAGSGGISVVIGGVSESLIATATGLCVAIPAVIAYNFFMKVIDNFAVEMDYSVSALKEIIDSVLKDEK
ncbi:MAG: MotA/TolQ/ExbB proton channel family protein [Endomicrobiia bacterium]|nr:MotA/TolQ/ExbB proton channel family protein [Endomicrobiaceae bacterium]MDD3053231.1 MotA/TolQ/ExbB proton channel family protein [Endomicrobiaceae bacterium]MDD3922514.1 MotA/TolQ/ExbB proton channel family protein [Endomicrobiaceae bacterium]MDD5102454.1 MotA/TolQ/ExbB proton channel family protein [Endomicrobiaceae bacterium]